MKLSKRLKKIATYITSDDIVADIGCDHAQLCCYLILENHCKKAYACDINEMPLLQAKKNIEYYNLSSSIETILCDGLDGLSSDVNTIVIAGMGYDTVYHILESNKSLLNNKKIIIQINKDVYKLRNYISNNKYSICNESVVYEDKHYYEIICFNTLNNNSLNEKEIYFGKYMEDSMDYKNYLMDRKETLNKIINQLDSNNDKKQSLLKQVSMIDEINNQYGY